MAEYSMSASEVVAKLRGQVEEATGLTISAGIAPNRLLAKVYHHGTLMHALHSSPFPDLLRQKQAERPV
jgi:nucleotidyltransferase/DNA polymerase involved in DNA repair